jgi:hypothetical protein
MHIEEDVGRWWISNLDEDVRTRGCSKLERGEAHGFVGSSNSSGRHAGWWLRNSSKMFAGMVAPKLKQDVRGDGGSETQARCSRGWWLLNSSKMFAGMSAPKLEQDVRGDVGSET